ncbi:MAG: FtsX-like permease family protein [Candidatus Aminicenantes bacterium]|jgi:putative ABC transport system permease protein|nr:FtsX-like permease family protein [Candidatus Aminicenantes bacterium]
MLKLFKIAVRNLSRYKRRTLLTSSLIAIGVMFVLVFVAASGSFKYIMIGQITDSMLGHLQVHKRGYVASIDSLPLTLNLSEKAEKKLEETMEKIIDIESFSPRIKFGGMFSNFIETTNIRVNGVYPEKEIATVPLFLSRIKQGKKSIKEGEILIPELLANGLKVKVGDTVVVIATNRDGSVNGKKFVVGGIIESVTGPGGRDGYMHIKDAMEVLRMEEMEISEVAIRLKDFSKLNAVSNRLDEMMSKELNKQGKPIFDVRTWEKLSPFYNVARMIDVMTFFIKLMLIAIVLVSIMNVMIMAVFERIREIGTISAIGTKPKKILSLFLIEGFSLGVFGAAIGNILALGIVFLINLVKITFNFGRQSGLVLSPSLSAGDILWISAIVILVSVVAAFQPAFKASRMEPVDALRHV